LERHAVQFLSIGEVSLFSNLCILCIKSQSLSAIKLWDGEIGSLEKTDNAKTVLFPSFTLCPLANRLENGTSLDPTNLGEMVGSVGYKHLQDDRFVCGIYNIISCSCVAHVMLSTF
jgi:hypothetical protein